MRRLTPVIIGLLCGLTMLVASCGGTDAQRTGRTVHPPADLPGGLIAFQRHDPRIDKVRIYTIRPDGSGLRAITEPPANAAGDAKPDISPDGSTVVFRRLYNDGTPDELFVVGLGGGAPRNIWRARCPGDACLGSEEPAWSPKGTEIVFSGARGPIPFDGPPPAIGIFVINADGTNLRQLTQHQMNSGTEDHMPSWSPDGERIAFMRANNTAEPENASSIYAVDADGGNLTLLRRMPPERPGAGRPRWSPDGRRILFDDYCLFGNCGQPPTGAQLFTTRSNGEVLRQLTDLPGNSCCANWSPDGRWIVFSRNPTVAALGDLYLMRRDGTQLWRLTHALRFDNHNADWGTQ
jgi:Tol biopolymer transport system component